MQNKVYLAFQHPNRHDSKEKPVSGLEDFIIKVLEALVPVGNPDFENQLSHVEFWSVEFDKEKENTTREIGYDRDNNIVVILPLNNNLGYWSNNNLSLDEYIKLDAKEITAEQFEADWSCFQELSV